MALEEIGLSPQEATSSLPTFSAARSWQKFPLVGPLNDRLATLVSTRAKDSLNYCQSRFERFARYDKILQMMSKRKPYEWKANVFLPYALMAAEQSAAIKFKRMMQQQPIVPIDPHKGGIPEVADHREALLGWHFDNDLALNITLPDILRSCERYGKAVALIAPDWDLKTIRYREKVNIPTSFGPIARMEWKTTTERAYRLRLQSLDLVGLRPQPGRQTINGPDGMDWFCREYYQPLEDIESMEQDGLWGPMVGGQPSQAITTSQEQPVNEWVQRRLMLLNRTTIDFASDQFDRYVKIVEYQGFVPEECIDPTLAQMELQAGLDPRYRLITCVNEKVIGINQALPWDHGYKSFVEMDCIPNVGDFWSVGKVEPIEHLVYAGNEILNMRIDNVKAAINGLIGVDGTRMPPGWKKKLISQPFGVHEVLGIPSEIMQRLQLGDVTASSYKEQDQIFGLIQEADSVNETLLGSPGGAVRTLGEQQLKAGAAGTRLDFELSRQSAQFLSASRQRPGLIYMTLMLDRQYMPLGQLFSIMDPDVPDAMTQFSLEPADLSDDLEKYSFMYPGTPQAQAVADRRMELMNLMQILAPFIPMLASGGVDLLDLIKQIMRAHNVDTSRIFRGAQMPQLPPGMPGEAPGGQPGMPMLPPPPGGGNVTPMRGRGVAGGPMRPDQRARPGAIVAPPWAGSGMGPGGFQRISNGGPNVG
jgi:hypothetical protein